MKKITLTLLIGIFIFSCSQNPKSKQYNKETITEDILNFTDKEKELIMTYILRESMSGIFSGDTSMINLESLTYEDMILKQREFITEQRIKDSLEVIEEEKRRVVLQQKQDSLQKLVQITVMDIYKSTGSYSSGDMCMKVKMISTKNKKINSLKFRVTVKDKKGNDLGQGVLRESDSFTSNSSSSWCWSSYDDLYSILSGSSVEDYHYSYEIISMIYDGELIELD